MRQARHSESVIDRKELVQGHVSDWLNSDQPALTTSQIPSTTFWRRSGGHWTNRANLRTLGSHLFSAWHHDSLDRGQHETVSVSERETENRSRGTQGRKGRRRLESRPARSWCHTLVMCLLLSVKNWGGLSNFPNISHPWLWTKEAKMRDFRLKFKENTF